MFRIVLLPDADGNDLREASDSVSTANFTPGKNERKVHNQLSVALTPPRSAKLKDMGMTFEAVYENGVLRPLESLALPNLQHVLVTIASAPATADDVSGYFEPEEWEAAKHDDISLQEVRHALSSIPGSLADAVIASREER